MRRPEDDAGPVEIRAFRGTRRASVYREHILAESAFARILAVGARRGLPLLRSLVPRGPHELDKGKAKQLAAETGRIQGGGDLPDLDADLTAIAEIARWCARATGRSWLRIEGP